MTSRDEFSPRTKRILAERAGQRCCNPDCDRSTSGPAEGSVGQATRTGKAAHITAAAHGGPRFDATLTSAERSSADNGIWLCSICADHVDKRENSKLYPVEKLRHWKRFSESTVGTDQASRDDRAAVPIREIVLNDFAGAAGEVRFRLGAVTIFQASSKLSATVGELIGVFCDRSRFLSVRQPTGTRGVITNYPLDEPGIVLEVSPKEPRRVAAVGRITLLLSDGRRATVTADGSGSSMSIDDAPLPAFTPILKLVSMQRKLSSFLASQDRTQTTSARALAAYFGLSPKEIRACIAGLPSDTSPFSLGCRVAPDEEVFAKPNPESTEFPLRGLSGGEQDRVALDISIRIATYLSRVSPTVLAIDQAHVLSLDSGGWAVLLEWFEAARRPFQVVVDRVYRPSGGALRHAFCYEFQGKDMRVSGVKQMTWEDYLV